MNLNIMHTYENGLQINCEGYDENLLKQRIFEYQSVYMDQILWPTFYSNIKRMHSVQVQNYKT